MKYRVKDPKKRKLVKDLFDIEIFNSNFADTELRVDLSFAGHNFASNYLPVEKVPELADGWNPYPETKPQKEGNYLCVVRHTPSNSIFHSVITFTRNKFVDWDLQVFAWRELPKTWEEE